MARAGALLLIQLAFLCLSSRAFSDESYPLTKAAALDKATSLLASEDSSARKEGVQLLVGLESEDSRLVDLLRQGIKDPDVEVRRIAAGAYADLTKADPAGASAGTSDLLDLLADADPGARSAGARALAHLVEDQQSVDMRRLSKGLVDSSPEIRATLVGAFLTHVSQAWVRESDLRRTLPGLRACFTRSEGSTRVTAMRALVLARERDPGTLSAGARDPSPEVRRAALLDLKGDQADVIVEILVEGLEDPDAEVRWLALEALSRATQKKRLRAQAVLPILMDREKTQEERWTALSLIGRGRSTTQDNFMELVTIADDPSEDPELRGQTIVYLEQGSSTGQAEWLATRIGSWTREPANAVSAPARRWLKVVGHESAAAGRVMWWVLPAVYLREILFALLMLTFWFLGVAHTQTAPGTERQR